MRFKVLCLTVTLCFFTLLGCQTQPPDPQPPTFAPTVQCMGSPSAQHKIVYLHGMHGEQFSQLEKRNLANLERLANIMDLQIAIPQNSRACHFQGRWQRCWGMKMTKSEARDTLRVAQTAADQCFPRENMNFGIIGFGNGGYIATKVFGYCLAPQFAPELQYVITVGAGRLWGSGYSAKGNLRRCRPITLVVGKRDRYNYQSNQKYLRTLDRKGADTAIVVFDGAHELPYGPMVTALRKHLF